MCGIAGIISREGPVASEDLDRMAPSLARRGPDDEGRLVEGRVGLLHRRLSIIDLAGGRQPICNEDGSLAIVCNGELYDYREHRRALLAAGHTFRTASDSEVVLHLYEEYGAECLARMNGMFAFAIVDLRTGDAFLARDRFGQKPLFYAIAPGRLAFASGPAALAALPWVDDDIDPTAVHDYLEYQYVPQPRCVYRGIHKLPPGNWGEVRRGTMTVRPYWTPRAEPEPGLVYADCAEAARRLFIEAVRRRLVADVPVGTFLSGGMDSSLVTAVASELRGGDLDTFSIGFPEKRYDERAYAEQVSRHLRTRHHFLEVDPSSFADLAAVVELYEEPFSDASMLPTALLSRFTRAHLKVALSGDGADELFGGYYRYRAMHLLRLLSRVPVAWRRRFAAMAGQVLPAKLEERTVRGRLRRLVELTSSDGLERYLTLISRFPAALRDRVYSEEMRAAVRNWDGIEVLSRFDRPSADVATGLMELDCRTYLPDDILVKVDRASMGHGLEVRSPFLDAELAAFALRLPYAYKQRWTSRKRLLHTAFRGVLPEGIFTRPKMGFGLPVARWFRGSWQAPARSCLLDGLAVQRYFSRPAVAALLDEHAGERADHSYPLFALLVFEMWLSGRSSRAANR